MNVNGEQIEFCLPLNDIALGFRAFFWLERYREMVVTERCDVWDEDVNGFEFVV